MQRHWGWFIAGCVGVACVLLVLCFYYFGFPIILRYKIGQTLAITEGSDAYDRYKQLPVLLSFEVYFFNLTNELDFINGAKPNVSQVGPYIYKENITNQDIVFNYTAGTVTGNKRTRFEFDANASYPLTEDDIVHPFNFIIEAILQTFLRLGPGVEITAELVELALPNILGQYNTPVIRAPVRNLMFDGIQLKCNNDSYGFAEKLVCSALTHFPSQSIQIDDNGDLYASIYNFKNSSDSGALEIYTGAKDFSRLGEIVSYEGSKNLSAWANLECNTVRGSFDETLIKPYLTKSSVIPLFMVDACRTTNVVFDGTMSYQEIDGYTFVPSDDFLADITTLPDNYCYCPGSRRTMTQRQGCLHRGAIDLTSCLGTPAVISFPHFYQASPIYLNSVNGLSPSKEKHGSYFNLEPNTGVPLSGARRVQLNFQVSREPSMRMFQNLTSTIIPIMWFDENFDLDDDDVNMIKNELLRSVSIVRIVVWTTTGVACLVVIVGYTMAFIRYKQRRRHED